MKNIYYFDKIENKTFTICSQLNYSEKEELNNVVINAFIKTKYGKELNFVSISKKDLIQDPKMKVGLYLLNNNSVYEKKIIVVSGYFQKYDSFEIVKKGKLLIESIEIEELKIEKFKLSNLMQILVKNLVNTNSIKEKCLCMTAIYELFCLNQKQIIENNDFKEAVYEMLLFSTQKMNGDWKEYNDYFNPIKYLEALFPKEFNALEYPNNQLNDDSDHETDQLDIKHEELKYLKGIYKIDLSHCNEINEGSNSKQKEGEQ